VKCLAWGVGAPSNGKEIGSGSIPRTQEILFQASSILAQATIALDGDQAMLLAASGHSDDGMRGLRAYDEIDLRL
jgi:hypothetical protein